MLTQFSLGTCDLNDSDRRLIIDDSTDKILSMDVKRKIQWVDNVKATQQKRRHVENTEMTRMRNFCISGARALNGINLVYEFYMRLHKRMTTYNYYEDTHLGAILLFRNHMSLRRRARGRFTTGRSGALFSKGVGQGDPKAEWQIGSIDAFNYLIILAN